MTDDAFDPCSYSPMRLRTLFGFSQKYADFLMPVSVNASKHNYAFRWHTLGTTFISM